MSKEDRTKEEKLVDILKKYGLTVATAESCTGGLLSGSIINVPGASEVIGTGIVTYSNDAKRKYLGVKRSTLKKHGAVSSKCASQMARGICAQTGADVGIATTGIAGPDGGTVEKPVGLVYIACFAKGKVRIARCDLSGDREQIRKKAVERARAMSYGFIKKRYKKHKKGSSRRKKEDE